MKTKQTGTLSSSIQLAFDVGHSSLGWAVFASPPSSTNTPQELPDIIATGVVLFPSDDCLARECRTNRSMRRHTRSTRSRIRQLAKLFAHLKLLSSDEFDARMKPPTKKVMGAPKQLPPWLLATRVLGGAVTLSGGELFDVLRWYAHNRGYDALVPWGQNAPDSGGEKVAAEQAQDAKRVQEAVKLMQRMGKSSTMAETITAYLLGENGTDASVDPKTMQRVASHDRRFKGLGAAFPRQTVIAEVGRILQAHTNFLEARGISPEDFRRALVDDWHAIPSSLIGKRGEQEKIWFPKRYGYVRHEREPDGRQREAREYGGILFGQFIPRFDNRLIETCPFTFSKHYAALLAEGLPEEKAQHKAAIRAKVPAKNCREFFAYRWSMLLADLCVAPKGDGRARVLNPAERAALNAEMNRQGFLHREDIEKVLAERSPGYKFSNFADMLKETPERRDSLHIDPARDYVAHNDMARTFVPLLPGTQRGRLLNQLRRGKSISLGTLRGWLEAVGAVAIKEFDAKAVWFVDHENLKAPRGRGRRKSGVKRQEEKLDVAGLLQRKLAASLPSGRARYHRSLMKRVVDDVLAGYDPRKKARAANDPEDTGEIKGEDGRLVETPAMRHLALGLSVSAKNQEKSYQEWLAGWLVKKSKKGAENNRRLYEQHGEDYARQIFEMRAAERWLAAQTNNHLVRQRLLILRRLQEDIVREFAGGDSSRIAGLAIEVTRDLLALSGMKKAEIGSDKSGVMKSIKAQHFKVKAFLEKMLVPAHYGHLINGHLIWKAKIADDLGWRCPYTGEIIDPLLLAKGETFDVDHIIPRSQRLSNAMEGLVVTFKRINALKGDRTAWQFVNDANGQQLEGMPQPIRRIADFEEFVKNLKTFRPPKSKQIEDSALDTSTVDDLNPMYLPGTDRLHPDFKRREKRKKLLMVQRAPKDRGDFTPRDLTLTGHINRLAQSTLLRSLPHLGPQHCVSIPGSVTSAVREMPGWRLLGALRDPDVCGELVTRDVPKINWDTKQVEKNPETGEPVMIKALIPKGDIRAITHLHHAVDACTLGVVAQLLPKDGKLWQLLAAGELTDEEQAAFKAKWQEYSTRGHVFTDFFTAKELPEEERIRVGAINRNWRIESLPSITNRARLKRLKEQLTGALKKKRVLQHVPAERQGMPTDQTVYRVLTSLDGEDAVSRHALAIVKEKQRLVARYNEAFQSATDKAVARKLRDSTESLRDAITKLTDFQNSAWIISRVRANEQKGKDKLKALESYQAWLAAKEQILVQGGATSVPKIRTSGGKPPKDPKFLRPYRAGHTFLWLYDIQPLDKLVGPAPEAHSGAPKLRPLKAAKEINQNFAIAILDKSQGMGRPERKAAERIVVVRWKRVHRQLAALRGLNGGIKPQLLRKGDLIEMPDAPKGEKFCGIWRIVYAKDNEAGVQVDIIRPEFVKPENKKPYAGMNVSVATLLEYGLKVIAKPRLTRPTSEGTRITSVTRIIDKMEP